MRASGVFGAAVCGYEIFCEGEGMLPAKVRDDSNGKAGFVEDGVIWVVMACGRNSAKKIAQRTPPESHRLGHLPVKCDYVAGMILNIKRPLGSIEIGGHSEPGEKSEFEMIVRVDKTGEERITGEIDLIFRGDLRAC